MEKNQEIYLIQEESQTLILWLIGIIYIAYFLCLGIGSLLLASLSCGLGGCNDVSAGLQVEAAVSIVSFFVALLGFPDLRRKMQGARIIYIALGLVFISKTLFVPCTIGWLSLKNTLTNIYLWAINLPMVFGTMYLAIPRNF